MQFSLYDPLRPNIPRPKEVEKKKRMTTGIKVALVIIVSVTLTWTIWRVIPGPPRLVILLGVDGELTVDGVPQGLGREFLLPQLGAGRHDLIAKPSKPIPFITEQVERFDLQYGVNETIRLLQVAEVSFESKPPGASIILSSSEGDLSLGKTPIRSMIPVGHYDIALRIPGFPEYKTSLIAEEKAKAKITTDFEELALSQPGAKKLIENLIIGSFPPGVEVTLDKKSLEFQREYQFPSGFHRLCMFWDDIQVACTDVVLPAVGKPVIISWPLELSSPAILFARGVHALPIDARNFVVTQDGKTLLYNTEFGLVNAVDLSSGKLLWSEKIDEAFDYSPAIILGIDSEKVFGTAGIPPGSGKKAQPFAVKISDSNEKDIKSDYGGSSLPFTNTKFEYGKFKCFANVWEGPFRGTGTQRGIEAVIIEDGKVRRYAKSIDWMESVTFAGVSFGATGGKRPIFIFQTTKNVGWGHGWVELLMLDPVEPIEMTTEQEEASTEKPRVSKTSKLEEPDLEAFSKGTWISVKSPFVPKGVCFDGGFKTGNSIIIYDDHQIACVSYPNGKVIWRRYVEGHAVSAPTIIQAKGKDVVVLNFEKSPFELQLSLRGGEIVLLRKIPESPIEGTGGIATVGGCFVIGKDTVVSGVRRIQTLIPGTKGEYETKWQPTWRKVWNNALVISSPWGPLVIFNNTITVLGSHKLEPILKFSVPGIGTPKEAEVFGDNEFLAVKVGTLCWIFDRYGLIRGYLTGVQTLSHPSELSNKALIAKVGDRKVVIPWP